MTTESKKFQEPTEQEIAEYAYFLWISEGRVEGRDLDYWLQAKAQLVTARAHEAGTLESMSSRKTTVEKSAPLFPSARPTAKKRQARSTREPAYA